MKHWKKFSVLFLIVLLHFCEAKPEKTFYGIPEEESKTILTGVILNSYLEDTGRGTIRDKSLGIEWKKCTQGQVYRAAQNDCQGATTGSLITPNDNYLYSATPFNFCNLATNDCNTLTIPQVLRETDISAGILSEAFLSCNTDRTDGKSDWRVATTARLVKLASGGKTALLQYFPNTVSQYYWSSNAYELDPSGLTGRAIYFGEDDFGKEAYFPKSDKYYVRCVRNY